jgi:ABC-type transporter Mla subunit MlaD
MRGANEAKVGIVVVGALVLLAGGYAWLRGIGLGGEQYFLRLNGAANIAPGNDVRLQGVKIGQVKEVALDPLTQRPLLTLALNRSEPPYQLAKNYIYTVRQGSLVGENYVDIRGKFVPGAPLYIANNRDQVIPGEAAVAITDVTEMVSDQIGVLSKDFRSTLQNLNVTLDRINKGVLNYDNQRNLAGALDGVARLTKQASQGFGPQGIKITLGDESARGSLNNTLRNTAAASEQAFAAARNVNALTRNLGGVVQENRGQIRGLLGNLSMAANNAAGLTESLSFLLRDGGFKENSQIALNSLRKAAENVEAGTAGFRNIAADETAQKDLKNTIAALRVTTETLRDTVAVVNKAIADPANQNQLKTTLGVLADTSVSLQTTMKNFADISGGLKNTIGDPALQNNLKASAENLAGTLAATRAAAERVNGLLGGKRPSPSVGTSGGGSTVENGAKTIVSEIPAGMDFTYRRFTSDNVRPRNFGDVNFGIEFLGAPFRLGLANIGDGTDLTLQSGRYIGKNAALRYGIYRSKLGAGAQYQKGRFGLEGNAWDLNRRSYNVYGGFEMTPQVELLVGREHIGNVRSNSIGVRLRP